MKYTEEELEQIIDEMKGLLSVYKEADDKFKDDQDSKYWHDKYGERFAPYEDKLKKLNGDDFSLMDEARKEYHSQYSDLSDDEYCNALETNIKATLQRIWPDAEPEQIEQAAEEITETAVEEPKEEASPEDTETTTTTEETVDDEGNKEVEVTEETKPEESDEDSDPLEDFTKELEEEKAKTPKRK